MEEANRKKKIVRLLEFYLVTQNYVGIWTFYLVDNLVWSQKDDLDS